MSFLVEFFSASNTKTHPYCILLLILFWKKYWGLIPTSKPKTVEDRFYSVESEILYPLQFGGGGNWVYEQLAVLA